MPAMMSSGSIRCIRTSASHTNLPHMKTGQVFLPKCRICLPSAWYTVPSYFCNGTGYSSATSLDMKFTPLLVSTTALRSAPPTSAFTSIDGRYFLPLKLLLRIPVVLRQKRLTNCWQEQSLMDYVLNRSIFV